MKLIYEKSLDEATQAFKRVGGKIVKAFRCTTGKRKGRAVSNPADCFKKKDLVRARKAKISARKTRFARARKSKITNRKASHKILVRMNKRIKKK